MDNRIEAEINEKFRSATNRLVLLDYDGTLVNHTTEPETARISERISDIIRKLIDSPHTKIFIITGRGPRDIDSFLDHIPINIIAEHGAIIKDGGVWKNQINDDVLNEFTVKCPGSYIEEKKFSLTWHYRNAEPHLGYMCSRELIHLLKKVILPYNLKILDGNKVVEILMNETGKGNAVKKLLEKDSYDFVLSIGDDATDEEMFEFFLNNPNAFTIKVGEGTTCARYQLQSISNVESLLKKLSI
jgi:trehalose 6-phosphate synthase/phosphatase